MGRLEGKVAIITGAGQGIGLAYAERFVREGAKVVVAEIDEQSGVAAADRLRDLGEAIFVPTDISEEGSARECAGRTVERFGTIDVLVNNAALYGDLDHGRHDLGYLKQVFDVNLHGAWLMAKVCAPVMVEQRYGRIVNQASTAAYMYTLTPPGPFEEVGSYSYSQSKWGVVGLTKLLAGQLGQYNVTVNCIAPGVTLTDATRRVVPERYLDMIPMMSAMKRPLEPEHLTGAAVFFASDDAELVTGQVLCVDGGTIMPA